MMKIPESYANGNVKREILEKPHEEINGNTDIAFEYELIQEKLPSGQMGLGAVRFKIKRVKKNRTVVEIVENMDKNGGVVIASDEEQEIIDVFGCSLKEAKDILRTAKANDRTREQLFEVLTRTLQQPAVENKVGYVLTILKNGYNEPTIFSGRRGKGWNNNDLSSYKQMNMADIEEQILANV